MKTTIALMLLLAGQWVAAAPTCQQKVEMAADAALILWDPNGAGWTSSAEPVIEANTDDSGLPEDKDLHLWRIKEVSKPGQGLPTFNLGYAITRGDQFGGCTISKIIELK